MKQEVALLKQHNESILQTVYWSLSAIFTVLVIFVGASWFTNFRANEGYKAELGKDLERYLESRVSQEQANLRTSAQGYAQEALNQLSAQMGNLRHDFLAMKFEMLEVEAKNWDAQGVHGNELDRYFDMLEIATQLYGSTTNWRVSGALQGMQGALRKGAVPSVDEVRKFTAKIDQLDPSYGLEVERLKRLMSDAREEH